MSHRILVLIPARYESSRFPGKPLAFIASKSLIQRVCDNCKAANIPNLEYAVVTNNQQIEEHLKSLAHPVVRVDDDVKTGTERIALAKKRYFSHVDWDLVINLQGDEPLFKGELLKNFVEFSTSHNFDLTTLIKLRKCSDEDFKNRNVVKCAFNQKNSQCIYFSRAELASIKSEQGDFWFQHIGIYGFQKNALEQFLELEPSQLELSENLEQLRALSNGMSLGALECEDELIGVDTPDDIKRVEEALRNKN